MPKRILLADDSITIQKVVELTFSDGDYEVTAVNNGAKAIAKLAEMRPDVILSDIIMPEKNGYEVCEYAKSHPEYRTIPVVLLTGTFEPFDPDRADKAGCDAVVTKPFESQSLIHKVEELIQAARSTVPTAPQPAMPESEQLTTGVFTPSMEAPDFQEPGFQEHGSDIFGAAQEPAGETRAFSSMSFEDLQRMSGEPATPAAPPVPPTPEPSPWDEPAPMTGGETRAFPSMSFDDLQRMANAAPPPAPPAATPQPPPPPPPVEASPWDEPAEPAAPSGAAETRAFPMMNFDELQRIPTDSTSSPMFPPSVEASPWDEPSNSAAMPFDTTPPPAPMPEASPWEEQSEDFGGETRSFSRMSFEELQQLAGTGAASMPPPVAEPEPEAAAPEAMPEPEPTPEISAPEPLWAMPEEAPVEPEMSASPMEMYAPPLAEPEPAFEPESAFEPTVEPEPIPEPIPEPEPEPLTAAPTPASVPEPAAAATPSGDLTDEQVDRIARRVVQLMSDQVVRNIAWEVVPDMAEMVVKERIRQLESEG